MNKMRILVPERVWQKYTGEVKTVETIVELTPEFVKKINEISNGKVYFKSKRDYFEHVLVGHAFGYVKPAETLEKIIENFVIDQIKKNNYEVLGESEVYSNTTRIKIKEPISTENVDLTEFYNELEKIAEEIRKEKELRQRREELKKKLEDILSQKVDEFRIYSNGINIKVAGVELYIPFQDYEEAINKVENVEKLVIEELANELNVCKKKLNNLELKYEKLCVFVKERELENEFLEFLKEEREKEVKEEITEEFPEIFLS